MYRILIILLLINLNYIEPKDFKAPPYPGIIDKSQFFDKPTVLCSKSQYFLDLTQNISFYNSIYIDGYSPILVLSKNSYLIKSNDNIKLDLAIVSKDFIRPIEIQPNLENIQSYIGENFYFDDDLGIFFFFSYCDPSLTTWCFTLYNIKEDKLKTFENLYLESLSNVQYYDYNNKTLYFYLDIYTKGNKPNVLNYFIGSINILNFTNVIYNNYTVSRLKLKNEIFKDRLDKIVPYKDYIAFSIYESYNNRYILYKINIKTNEPPKLLFAGLPYKSADKFIVGPNPRYVLYFDQYDARKVVYIDLDNNEVNTKVFFPTTIPTKYNDITLQISIATSVFPNIIGKNLTFLY